MSHLVVADSESVIKNMYERERVRGGDDEENATITTASVSMLSGGCGESNSLASFGVRKGGK